MKLFGLALSSCSIIKPYSIPFIEPFSCKVLFVSLNDGLVFLNMFVCYLYSLEHSHCEKWLHCVASQMPHPWELWMLTKHQKKMGMAVPGWILVLYAWQNWWIWSSPRKHCKQCLVKTFPKWGTNPPNWDSYSVLVFLIYKRFVISFSTADLNWRPWS